MNPFRNILSRREIFVRFQQGTAIDLFSIKPRQLDEESEAYLDAFKLSDSPLKCAKAMSHSG